jgi:dienelactone hydrolase
VFEYFADNYNWSLATALAIGMGGELTEIDAACQPLRRVAASATTDDAQQVWIDSWTAVARRTRQAAERDEALHHFRSAARKWRRVAIYELMAERMISNVHPAKNETYRRALEALGKWRSEFLPHCEAVAVPFEDSVLPSLFVPAPGPGPGPVVIAWNGFDVTKEFLLLLGVDDWTTRGLSVLICDQPGSGEALRFHGLTARLDTEVAATACIDHLSRRADVDPARIGITGISMGGYYAPRAAAFEHRLAACAAWGAFHDLSGVLANLERTGAHSAPPFQGPWVFGVTGPEGRAAVLSAMTLDDAAAKISCPLLVLHGENDRQVPVEQAHRTIAAATNATQRDLRIVPAGEPGDQHCQVDLPSVAIDIVGDWFEEVLGRAGRTPASG